MKSGIGGRALFAGGWTAIGAAAAVVTGSTPIGIGMVAGVGGVSRWRTAAGKLRARG